MNGDANGVHSSGKNKSSTLIFGGIKPNKTCDSRSGKTRITIEEKSYNWSTLQKLTIAVQAMSDATDGDSTAASSTAAKSTVHCPNDGALFDNTVSENILKKISAAPLPSSAESTGNDLKVLYSVILQQKRLVERKKYWLY